MSSAAPLTGEASSTTSDLSATPDVLDMLNPCHRQGVFKNNKLVKEKNNFGCLGFAQLALLAPVAVLQERFKVISTLNVTVRPAACLLHQVT